MNYTDRHIIESYSKLLVGLNATSKTELIETLSKSLEAQPEKKDTDFYNSFGAFASDKPAEEIIAGIRKSKMFRDKEIKF